VSADGKGKEDSATFHLGGKKLTIAARWLNEKTFSITTRKERKKEKGNSVYLEKARRRKGKTISTEKKKSLNPKGTSGLHKKQYRSVGGGRKGRGGKKISPI